MASHINIQQIERFDTNWDWALADLKAKAELEIMTKRFEQAASQLDAIFTRIARGDEVELHYRDGSVIRVGATPSPNHESGEQT